MLVNDSALEEVKSKNSFFQSKNNSFDIGSKKKLDHMMNLYINWFLKNNFWKYLSENLGNITKGSKECLLTSFSYRFYKNIFRNYETGKVIDSYS